MTITNGYCTLAELKHANRLNITSSDTDADDMLESIVEAVSRSIDDKCNRQFYLDTSSRSRYYTAKDGDYLFIDEIGSTDSDVTIAIDTNGDGVTDNTFSDSDFNLMPYDANDDNLPYQKIEISAVGRYSFPAGVRKGVKVTAKFGWPAIPEPIKEACRIQSERIYKRGATPIGSESMSAIGRQTLSIPALDPDVEALICRYKKVVFG